LFPLDNFCFRITEERYNELDFVRRHFHKLPFSGLFLWVFRWLGRSVHFLGKILVKVVSPEQNIAKIWVKFYILEVNISQNLLVLLLSVIFL
jgi:hypothetical protein